MSHKDVPEGQRHPPHDYTYADAPARRSAGPFASTELHIEVLQTDDLSKYRLIQIAPPLWEPIQGATPKHAVMDDEFFGADLDAKWRKTIVGGSSQAQIINLTPSVLRLRAGANIGDCGEIDWGDNHSLAVSSNAELRVRIFPKHIDDVLMQVGLTRGDGSVDGIFFQFKDSVDTNWQAICRQGPSSETKVDTTIPAAVANVEMLIECKTGEIKFWIDGAVVATITTNIPTNTQQMHMRMENEAAVENKDLLLDFVRADEKR